MRTICAQRDGRGGCSRGRGGAGCAFRRGLGSGGCRRRPSAGGAIEQGRPSARMLYAGVRRNERGGARRGDQRRGGCGLRDDEDEAGEGDQGAVPRRRGVRHVSEDDGVDARRVERLLEQKDLWTRRREWAC